MGVSLCPRGSLRQPLSNAHRQPRRRRTKSEAGRGRRPFAHFQTEDFSMDYRRLGDSGLKGREIGLGCNNSGMRTDEDGTNAVIDAAIEHGVTFFDTADVYGGQGKSEEMMGVA